MRGASVQPLDGEAGKAHALVIDSNATSRSVLVQHLKGFGFGEVKQATRVIDARVALESRRFDVVITDYHVDQEEKSGQDLLEELRREHLLPYSTVFVMVTSHPTYNKVAEAAEAALDCYLIKPFSANALGERVREARQRKRAMNDIFIAIEEGRHDDAATLCLDRFAKRAQYWLYAARIGIELLLMQDRHQEAKTLCDAVIAAKTVPWARLGLARAQLASGNVVEARRTLEALLASSPDQADGFDVLGKVQLEQGHLHEALETYRNAIKLTPDSILRLQHCGALAFYEAEYAEAAEMIERAWSLGRKSRLFDVLSMLILALIRYDEGDAAALARAQEVLMQFQTAHPQSNRLRRFAALGSALGHALGGRLEAAHRVALEESEMILKPEFDMEGATNLVSLWARLSRFNLPEEDLRSAVRRIALRFCTSKMSTEVLLAAARGCDLAARCIQEGNAEVMKMAERAMAKTLSQEPSLAVEMLLACGDATGNAKLIEMSGAVARRYRDKVHQVDQVLHQVGMLSRRFAHSVAHVAGVKRSNRVPGGLAMRGTSTGPAQAAPPTPTPATAGS